MNGRPGPRVRRVKTCVPGIPRDGHGECPGPPPVAPTRSGAGRRRYRRTGGQQLTAKTWFITGASRGFGREWAVAALERGDRVAATARETSTLDDLVASYGDAVLPIRLDVTDRDADF